MNRRFRTHVAAAALALLPLPAAFLAGPAAAQHAAAARPALQSLRLDSNAGLAPGAVLRVQLVGTPGARHASATLGRSGVRVALREQAPGRYVGRHTVRRADRIDPLQAITVRARFGGQQLAREFRYPPAFEALARTGRDDLAPRVTQLAPGHGESFREDGRTFIRVRLEDAGSGVDPQSVRLLVDGLDVTRDAHVSPDAVGYRERLGRGTHEAVLLVRDRAGNESRTAWSFRVV